MKTTIEGIERGMLLLGPIAEGGAKYLFTVTRVHGRHSVEAITHIDKMAITITLNTNGLNREGGEWERVKLSPFVGRDAPPKAVKGFVVNYKFEPNA